MESFRLARIRDELWTLGLAHLLAAVLFAFVYRLGVVETAWALLVGAGLAGLIHALGHARMARFAESARDAPQGAALETPALTVGRQLVVAVLSLAALVLVFRLGGGEPWLLVGFALGFGASIIEAALSIARQENAKGFRIYGRTGWHVLQRMYGADDAHLYARR